MPGNTGPIVYVQSPLGLTPFFPSLSRARGITSIFRSLALRARSLLFLYAQTPLWLSIVVRSNAAGLFHCIENPAGAPYHSLAGPPATYHSYALSPFGLVR